MFSLSQLGVELKTYAFSNFFLNCLFEQDGIPMYLIAIIGAAVVLLIAVIVFVIVKVKSKKTKSGKKPKSKKSAKDEDLKKLFYQKNGFGKKVFSFLSSSDINDETWKNVETALLSADVGLQTSSEIIDNLKNKFSKKEAKNLTDSQKKEILKKELIRAIDFYNPSENDDDSENAADGGSFSEKVDTKNSNSINSKDLSFIRDIHFSENEPTVLLFVGVNGTGKTTTIGKLAKKYSSQGKTVVLGAADTFRAAASDQLKSWGNISNVKVIAAEKEGQDPASVAYKTVEYAKQNNIDIVMIDTAGRIHNNKNLMDQLAKVKRVIEKELEISEVLLVIDATTGQNAVVQSKEFSKVVDISGIVLTKMDGTAKGGIIISIQNYLGVPVKFVGLGEGENDLMEFDTKLFVDGVVE